MNTQKCFKEAACNYVVLDMGSLQFNLLMSITERLILDDQ